MLIQPNKKRIKSIDERTSQPKYYLSWIVSNDCYETVATFDYASKATAVALAEQLQKQGNGKHFVRAMRIEPTRNLLQQVEVETPPPVPPKPAEAPLTALVEQLLHEVAGLRQQVAQLGEDQEDGFADLYRLIELEFSCHNTQ